MPTGIYERKITRKGWIRKLDAIVKEIVLIRDKECVTCPYWRMHQATHTPSKVMEPGHLFTRAAYSTRWNLANVFKQCHNCNLKHEHDAYPFTRFYLDQFGQAAYDDLHKMYVVAVPIKTWELEAKYHELEQELAGLKKERGIRE